MTIDDSLRARIVIATAETRVDQLCDSIKRLKTKPQQRRFLATMLECNPSWEIEIAAVYAVAGLVMGAENAQ